MCTGTTLFYFSETVEIMSIKTAEESVIFVFVIDKAAGPSGTLVTT